VRIVDNKVILGIQDADSVVLRTEPDVVEFIFMDGIDFVGANVAVGIHVINRLPVFCFQAYDSGTAGRKPNVPLAVFDNAVDIGEIADVGIGKGYGDEFFIFYVEALYAGGGSYPEVPLGIFEYRQYGIVHQGGAVVRIVAKGLESHTVENVQAVVGTYPDESFLVLIQAVDVAIGYVVGGAVKFIGACG
jgi:hypothetical protein